MAKNNLFDQDIDLQGISKIINFRFDTISGATGTPIQNKKGAAYFSNDEKSIRLNIDGKHWFSTILFDGTPADVNYLAVFTPGTINQIEKLEGPDDGDALVQVSYDGSVSLVESGTINFLNYLDEAIYVDSVINGDTRLVTSNAVYDYVQAAISSGTGNYLPLAGGTMRGDIDMGGNSLNFFGPDNEGLINFYCTTSTSISGAFNLNLALNSYEEFRIVDVSFPDDYTQIRLTSNGMYPYNALTVSYMGTPTYPFHSGYINSAYIDTIQGRGIDSKLTLIGGASSTYTKIELGGDQVTVYDHLLPSAHMSKNFGGASMRWQYGYFNKLYGFQLTLSTGSTVIDISNTADIVEPASSSLLTESAIVALFNTTKTITGADVTDITTVGLVNRYTGVNPENYLLQADNTWINKTSVNYWTYDAGTYSLGLNTTDLDIAKFEFTVNSASADNVLAMGVRGNYVFEGLYDRSGRGKITVFIGDLETVILTDYTYPIEVIGNLRTRDAIYFGGTDLTDEGVVSLTDAVIEGINTLYIAGAVSTDGVNAWTLGEVTTAPTPNCGVEITINGTTFTLAAETAVKN